MAESARVRSRGTSPGDRRARPGADPGRQGDAGRHSDAGQLRRAAQLRRAERRLDEADELPAPLASGRPLPAALLGGLSHHLARDLSRIRLHHDWFAAELAEALDAQAVTHGDDIYFGADAADPSTPAGRSLLVHELFHSLGAGDGSPGGHQEEVEAESAGLAAGRGDLTLVPLTHQPGQPSMQAKPDGPDDAGEARSHADQAGRRTRVGLQAKATLTPHGDQPTEDVVSAGDALVRLVDRLFSKDPDDQGGRLAAVLGRLEMSLRDAVVTAVVARNGGHAGSILPELAHEPAPQDGGHAEPAADVAGVAAAEATVDHAGDAAAVPEARPEVTADAEAAETGRTATEPSPAGAGPGRATAATPEPAVSPETAVDGDERAPVAGAKPGPGVEEPAEAEGEATPSEQPPAVASLDVPAAELAPPPAAPPAGQGVVPGGPASAPPLPSGGEAPVAVAESPAAETAPGAGPAAGEAAPGAGLAAGEGTGPDTAPIAAPVSAAAEPEAAESAAAPEAETGPEAGAGPAAGEPDGTLAPAEAATSEAATVPDSQPADEPGPAEAQEAEVAEPAPAEEEPSAEPEPAPAEAGEAAPAPAETTEAGAIPAGGTEAETEPAEAAATETAPGESPPAEPAEGQFPEADVAAVEPGSPGPEAGGIGTTQTAAPPMIADTEPTMTDPPAPSGGGDGGGAAIADPPEPAAPDVSAMEPQAALGAVASLPVTKLASSLTGVSAAAQRTVADGQADLAANPPGMERPSGVPADKDASLPPAPLPPLPTAPDRTVPQLAGGPGAQPPVPGTPPPAPARVTLSLPEAKASGDTQISAEDAARIQGAVNDLPTTDPALDVTAGPVPELELSGGEDPKQVTDQAASVEDATAGARQDGLADARADMGENDVLPQVPKETLTADVSGDEGPPAGSGDAATAGSAASGSAATAPAGTGAAGAGAGINAAANGGGAGGGAAAVPAAAIDAVAAEKGAEQINAATQAEGAALGTARDDHESSVEQAKSETDKQINDEITNNGAGQTQQRRDVRAEVGADRKAWVGEQDKVAADSRQAAGAATKTAGESVGTARSTARNDATKAVKDGNESVGQERAKAEKTAREQREKAKKESEDGGFFSWLGSKVKSFFNGIKRAIHAAFDLARKAVDIAISAAQKLAVAAIELGRKAVVAAIELGGKALAAAGDIVLAGFPEARERFRKKIEDRVAAAKKAVNELADQLKANVKKLLDGLGKLLKGALTLLEKAYTAAIDAVAKVVDTVIKAAKAFVNALVNFAVLIADIASDPVGWLRNLGAALVDGVKNHTWPALVSAVKGWFKSKVEEVVGVGKAILDVLRNGGITFGKVVTMAWTAIKESLPGILIQLLVEKLVAMLIPAAGALSVIIDGIKAAWAAASRILAAFQKFIAFLKAVKGGNAGPKFGDVVGAAAVAVMDFLANFVLSKLKGAGQKVGGTLRKMAERFMKAVKKGIGVLKRGAKAAAGAIRRGLAATGRALKRGATALGRTAKRMLPRSLARLGARAAAFIGRKAKAGVAKAKALYGRVKKKLFGKPKRTVAQRIAATRTTIRKALSTGISRLLLRGLIKYLSIRHHWKRLDIGKGDKRTFEIRGDINPVDLLVAGGTEVPLPSNPFVVAIDAGEKMSQFGGKTATASGYEAASGKLFASLLKPSFPGREVVLDDRRYKGEGEFRRTVRARKSTANQIVISPQLKTIEGEQAAGQPKLDYRAVVGGQALDPTGGVKLDRSGKPIRDRSKDVVYIFEPTLLADFLQGTSKQYKEKQGQALNHLLKLVTRKEFADARAFVYTIVTTESPDPDVLQHLSEVQQAVHNAAPGKEIYIVHRKVGK